MSAGKSSLINALIGSDLLWSANEAATATITRIHHSNKAKNCISGICFDWQGNCHDWSENINNSLIQQWNALPEIKNIELQLELECFTSSSFKPVIYDTPGANNSQDATHASLFNEALLESENGIIIYILNATQLGTNDDAYLLREIKSHLCNALNKRIIFVLNKVDELDDEKGETIENILHSAYRYLENLEFSSPIIIPSMMSSALIAKKIISGTNVTRAQRNHLQNELIRFRQNKNTLNNAAIIPNNIRNILNHTLASSVINTTSNKFNEKELIQFINYSGLKALELYLNHYL